MADYGNRVDGTPKGMGWFGELRRPDGGVSTELSAGFDFGKGQVEVPLIVPTLSREELDLLLSGAEPTEVIFNKAANHAMERIKRGKSPFAGEGDQAAPLPQVFTPPPMSEIVR